MIEIERKFLVKNNTYKKEAFKEIHIKQGFLSSDKNKIVRIRITDNQGFITVKGPPSNNGISRFEWEKEISKTDAEALFNLCEEGRIEKTRYLINKGNHTFEVDEFYGANEGLIVAEIELNHVTELFIKPAWLDKEVTGDTKYYNSQLSKSPYKSWTKK
ncbi:CYTH domain-containing protein [Xanthomarina sp. F2636L]|uniref:CYTH domain-containing protein n=1 Tax=Xanthomarina sp. F2636L TaxID=2996018 RepID=UPI00225E652D|nr:CYTH domain-containing protein [Xanthomarina sp. F2636L]MCX7551229.1 CYTH domain-containing protein [Xanthomarina sp. F2636L]